MFYSLQQPSLHGDAVGWGCFFWIEHEVDAEGLVHVEGVHAGQPLLPQHGCQDQGGHTVQHQTKLSSWSRVRQ